MAFSSFIGATIALSANEPATEDQTGYEAMSYTALGNVTMAGEMGDTAEDISFPVLASGRMEHVTGVKDGGAVEVQLAYNSSDAGLTILKAGNNTNTIHSIKVTDPDTEVRYYQVLLANLRMNTRDTSTHKGMTFEMRVLTDEVLAT